MLTKRNLVNLSRVTGAIRLAWESTWHDFKVLTAYKIQIPGRTLIITSLPLLFWAWSMTYLPPL